MKKAALIKGQPGIAGYSEKVHTSPDNNVSAVIKCHMSW